MAGVVYDDTYKLINALNLQITGAGALQAVDTKTFIAVGQQMLAASTDNIYGAISNSWSRTIFAARVYTSGVFRSVEVDEERWGFIKRKISFEPLEFEESHNWNTDENPTQLADGSSIDPFKIRKAKPVQFAFYGSKALQSHITHFRDELEAALQSEEEFQNWYDAKMVEYWNDIETKDEAERRLTVLNYIAGTINMNGNCIVDLTAAYNTKFGTTYTRQQLLSTYVDSFMKFAAATMQSYSKKLRDRTAIYHDNVTGHTLLRHTPRELQKMLILEPFITSAKAEVYSGLFNPEYLEIGTYEEVNFWQDPLSPSEINIKPQILNTSTGAQADGTAQNPKYVVGMLYDERALVIANKRRSAASIMNPDGDYVNDYIHWLKRFENDYTENHIVFIMGDGGNAKADAEPESGAKKSGK